MRRRAPGRPAPTELERGTRDDPIVLDPPGKFQCIVERRCLLNCRLSCIYPGVFNTTLQFTVRAAAGGEETILGFLSLETGWLAPQFLSSD